MLYCSNCGKKLDENYKFCPGCGKELTIKSNVEDESLYADVVKFVVQNNKASISLIQKEFKISYAKASKLINLLEERGVVGPQNGNKPREVILNKINEAKEQKEVKSNKFEDNIKESVEKIMDTPDTTSDYEEKDIKDNMPLAILSYISFLAFIPYFAHNNSKFVKYHATQGMNLLIMWLAYTILDSILGLVKVSKVVVEFGGITGTQMITPLYITIPMIILRVLLTALSVMGIVYVCQGKAKELPIVGKLKIVK